MTQPYRQVEFREHDLLRVDVSGQNPAFAKGAASATTAETGRRMLGAAEPCFARSRVSWLDSAKARRVANQPDEILVRLS